MYARIILILMLASAVLGFAICLRHKWLGRDTARWWYLAEAFFFVAALCAVWRLAR